MAELTNVLLYESGLTPEPPELRASASATGASSGAGTLLVRLLCPLGWGSAHPLPRSPCLCKQLGCEQWMGSMGKERSHVVIFSLS